MGTQPGVSGLQRQEVAGSAVGSPAFGPLAPIGSIRSVVSDRRKCENRCRASLDLHKVPAWSGPERSPQREVRLSS